MAQRRERSVPVHTMTENCGGRYLGTSERKWTLAEEAHGVGLSLLNSIGDKLLQVLHNECETSEVVAEMLYALKAEAYELHKVGVIAEQRKILMKRLKETANRDVLDIDVAKLQESYEKGVSDIRAHTDGIRPDNPRYTHNEFNEINKILQVVTNQDDNDDDVQEDITATQQQKRRCPILSSALVQPYKSIKCGHVYSLPGIIQLMSQVNGRANMANRIKTLDDIPAGWSCRCPVAGCQQQVRREFLRRDYMTEQTQRELLETETPGRGRDSMGVDVEDLVTPGSNRRESMGVDLEIE